MKFLYFLRYGKSENSTPRIICVLYDVQNFVVSTLIEIYGSIQLKFSYIMGGRLKLCRVKLGDSRLNSARDILNVSAQCKCFVGLTYE